MRTICTLAVAGFGAMLVAGCQTYEPGVAVVRTTTVQQYQSNAIVSDGRVAADVRSVCSSYGLQPGTQLYANCLVREADRRHPSSYAGHFARPGERYDQNGHLVDTQGFLIDKSGRRIGGRGYWVQGPGDTVPPGTYVGPQMGQAIMAPPPHYATTTTTYSTRSYPYSNTTAYWQ
jgi:hypothetical protein